MEYEPSPSNTGVQETPALVVFQTPPDATAAKYWLRSFGFTAKPTTRPDISAGPMERNFSDAIGCGLAGASGGLAGGWPPARGGGRGKEAGGVTGDPASKGVG